MTGKERMRMAFTHGGEPDRVPVEPGLDFDTLVDLSGLDYWQFLDEGRTELGSLIEWSDRLGFEVYDFLGDIPEPHPPAGVTVTARRREEGEIRIEETNVETAAGRIQQRRRQPRRNPSFAHEKFIKDISADWPVFRSYFGTDWPLRAAFVEDYRRAGDRGAVGVVVHSPIDWWQEYRHGGIEQVIYDLYDEPARMEAVFAWYREQSLAWLGRVAARTPKPDFVMIHGSNCSASVISPEFFTGIALPYIREVSSFLKRHGIPSLFHVCGKSRPWLDHVADTDLDVIDALECPPTGNVDLAEVKRQFGGRLCLKGNISVLAAVFGTPAEVEREVKRCIDAAAPGGGFMLCVGDSIGPKSNRANTEALVRTALDYGRYRGGAGGRA